VSFAGRIHRLITDALAVWRGAGANRPFTRRGMTDGELFEEYRHSQDDPDEETKTGEQPPTPERSTKG